MPVQYQPQKKKVSKKSRGLFGSIVHGLKKSVDNPVDRAIGHAVSGTSKGLYHGVTGFPTGAYMAGRAVGHDLLHPARFGHGRTDKLAKNLVKSEYDAYRHFGRGGDFSTPLLDLLAALSGGGALVGKGAALSRSMKAGEGLTGASRAIVRSHPHSRSIPGTPYSIPVSPNPLIRGVQKASLKNQKVAGRALKRRDWQAERFHRQLTQGEKTVPYSGPVELPPGVTVAAHEAKAARNVKDPMWKKTIDAPMNALRLAMWARPRYYTQNIAQTGQMLGSRPVATTKAVQDLARIRKQNPKLYADLKNITGEGQALASQAGTLARGKIMDKAGQIANAPEAHVRVLSILTQLRREGFTTEKQMENAINQLRTGKPGSKALNAAIRANEDVGDFGRLSKTERQFMKTQIPIFYPMFKALSRYGYRFPSEHAIQASAGLKVGKQGKAEQKRLLGDLPFWAQYLIPKSAGDPNAKKGPKQAVFNPGNIYNLQPATDITRQVIEAPTRKGGPIPGVNLLQEIGPFAQILHGIETGKDIQTGYPIKGKTGRSGPDAVLNFLSSLPLTDLVALSRGAPPTHVRSYEPGSTIQRLLMELGPGPAFVPRTLRTGETTKQAKREVRVGHGRKKRKRKTSGRYPSYP